MDAEVKEQASTEGGVANETSKSESFVWEFPDGLENVSDKTEIEPEEKAEESGQDEESEEKTEEPETEETDEEEEKKTEADFEKKLNETAERIAQSMKDKEMKPLYEKLKKFEDENNDLKSQLEDDMRAANFQVYLEKAREQWEEEGEHTSKISRFQDEQKQWQKWINQSRIKANEFQRAVKQFQEDKAAFEKERMQTQIEKIAAEHDIDYEQIKDSESLEKAEIKALRLKLDKQAKEKKVKPKKTQKIDSNVSSGEGDISFERARDRWIEDPYDEKRLEEYVKAAKKAGKRIYRT